MFPREALDRSDRGQDLEGAPDEGGFEGLDPLRVVDHGTGVEAKTKIKKRRHDEGEKRQRQVHVDEDGKHDCEFEGGQHEGNTPPMIKSFAQYVSASSR